MTTEKTLTLEALHHFTGTETWFRHPLVRKVLYTEGVQYLAETGGAYWLLDEIACAQLIGVGKGLRPPRPPNWASGSPAPSSPVGSFLIGIGSPKHGRHAG